MGCLRIGFAFIISLFITAIFITVGIFLGTLIPLVISAQVTSFSTPLAIVEANPTGALIGGGIGALIGLFTMVAMLKRASDVNWLKKNGTRITAMVSDIETKRGSRQVAYYSQGRTAYRTEWYTYYVIVAHWANPYTQQMHTFHSDRLNIYPKRYYSGSGISVLIDPQNLGRYLVEV